MSAENKELPPMTEYQVEQLRTVLSITLAFASSINEKAQEIFTDFISGKIPSIEIGIFTLSRDKDDPGWFSISRINRDLVNETEQLKIGAVTVFIHGRERHDFYIPKDAVDRN